MGLKRDNDQNLANQGTVVSIRGSVQEILLPSAANENASRMASLQAAERNIEESLDGFRSQYHHQRQDSITAEILDIVAGFEALVGEEVTTGLTDQ